MKIEFKCFGDLAKKYECDYDGASHLTVEKDSTISSALAAAGIAESDVKLIFLNGRAVEPQHLLKKGDRLSVAPATGGM